ncbi:Nitrogen permease regulator 2 [Coccidioides posadasii str. Silveira]|uniref:Nitrogen permease regulator Npr2 n=3 Tax=Coccidioides posadasii TaxID=199306 RepID=E9DFD1_COCPS|nr:Nitrogen permease regulator 2 family protein [Coccidioides posadasii C735 delta SOWgp]EER29257.1 Nitrogen permease regulator 2 family protein [Coccidioides posadasii C735 delta SOWgp]EFW14788.1 nitrogen permease regulator Npr2 [Coccidioides posadasii str. Silveira]KMM70454.1 nitrogen permease regulator 2 [Coccidioides posadasii RMSCC 3488]QVM05842.1 Nitrogen permease regulator 2 [Coccidioides posadasii str. Silveira]|eukprot:XP_003071402.1 Nitrogen permease regulator 2 family protein [Coccidioides posadasii C735 delta SOWgp]
MIKAIFYSKFDTQSGRKVVHQVPDGAIVPSSTAPPGSTPLFNFSDISFFVIPRQELCGNLIQVCTNGHRVLGFPVCIKSPSYDRNEFIFNFCVVLAEEDEWGSFKSVVQKLADLMCELEEQSGFLSKDPSPGGEGKVHSLCETLMEDLNNYCECMIPIDDLNTLNVKLFPLYPSPPPVKAWQVPLFTVRYEAFMDENWDITVQRIVPYINGVNSIRAIAVLADANFSLTCRAIRHLVYYGCVFLLDIFSFSAIYAPTAQFGFTIASDEEMQRECARYVNTRFSPTLAPAKTAGSRQTGSRGRNDASRRERQAWADQDNIWPQMGKDARATGPGHTGKQSQIVDGVGIVELYASLKQGQSVKQWYLEHTRELANIDVRRFITFGVIKGFLYRVHKYPYATGQPAQTTTVTTTLANGTQQISFLSSSPSFTRSRMGSTASGIESMSSFTSRRRKSGHLIGPTELHSHAEDHSGDENDHNEDEDGEGEGGVEEDGIDDKTLTKFLDGMHCFDEICTELEISEKELTSRLKRYPGEVLIIHR